jgi:hypothetical protein
MQTLTGAAYLGKNLVRNQSSQACQHGIAQEMKQHRGAPSGAASSPENDPFKVADPSNVARKRMLNSTI